MNKWLWFGLGLILLGGTAAMTARGIRNNNPGNIKKSGTAWKGETSGSDPVFVTFVSPAYGIRAIGRILNTYYTKYGLKTIRDIITRYAPGNENDTAAYINSVSRRMNVPADSELIPDIDFGPLVEAIIYHENGSNPYPMDVIEQSLRMA